LRQTRQGGIRKIRKVPHNNTRYTKEEKDFIRYYKLDVGTSWDDVRYRFGEQFPVDEDKERRTQGVQGVHYRENKTLPALDRETNSLIYLANGHMERREVACREQNTTDKKAYGLLNLWPEAALNYQWVKEEHKQQAAKLGK
jgi:hypothetical protein